MSDTCLLIDGSGFVYRAYYGFPKLSRKDGAPIGAVYGVCAMLLPIIKKTKAKYWGIVFDNGRHTFRTDKYPEYKANRSATPDDLVPQFGLIRSACRALGLPVLSKDGVEADDVIATISKRFRNINCAVEIVSSDKDLLQLVDEYIHIFDPAKSKYMFRNEVYNKFGVYPEQVRDFLALVGDAADNVPGAAGIGPKTAAKLLAAFGDIDTILEKIEEIVSAATAKKIIESIEKIKLSYWLVGLKDDVEYDISENELLNTGINYNSAYDFFVQNGFQKLLSALG